MQALYAHQANTAEDIVSGEKKLDQAIRTCENLSYYFYSLFPEIKRYLENKFAERKDKNFPTEEDLNPNTKFVDNLVIKQIEESTALNKKFEQLKINWSQQPQLIISLFSTIAELPDYVEYMSKPGNNYYTDKELVLEIIEKVFAESELLHWYFEEKFVHWFDDYNDALLQTYQAITFWKSSMEQVNAGPLFKDEVEDVNFYKKLYRLTIQNDDKYLKIIDENLHNWESDRTIETDLILMKMATCELMEFPSIPVKVTINEYIEIAKTYGSERSGGFINGLIDKIANDLREEGLLNKQGRGLLNQGIK